MASKEAALKCCTTFWRILFLILNVVFMLIGLALTGLGIYLLASDNDLEFLTGNQYASGGTLILISGIVTFIIALIGVIGAAGMWFGVMIIYIIVLVIVIILEIVAGVLGFVYRADVETFVVMQALDAIDQYEDDVDNDVTAVVDFMQSRFSCCGFESFDEWFETDYFNTTQMFPDSCNCTNVSSTVCITPVLGLDQIIFDRNCSASVRGFIEENLVVVGAVGITFAIIELFGLFIAIGLCCCFCAIRKDEDEYDFSKAI